MGEVEENKQQQAKIGSAIDIGITITATVYLHDTNNEVVKCNAKDVKEVYKTADGQTAVSFNDEEQHDLIVIEEVEDVETAVLNAKFYRNEALQTIRSLLKEQ